MADRRPIERPGADGNVSTDAWIDGESGMLVVHLQDVLERPEGARGPEALMVDLGASAPLKWVALSLRCDEGAVLDAVVERWSGRGGDLLDWVRGLPGADAWSGPDMGRPTRADGRS